jgi:anti-sigma B factor antagonist
VTGEDRSNPLLTTSVEHWNGLVRVRLAGELDLSSRPYFDRALQAAEPHASTGILIDIENLVFMDSTGLSALLEALKRAEEANRGFGVTGAREEIRRLLAVAGLLWLLESPAPGDGQPDESVVWEPVPLPDGDVDG